MSDSIELPSASVENAATTVADRKAGHAKVWFGVAAFFAFVVVAMLLDNAGHLGTYTKSEALIGGVFWVGLFSTIGGLVVRRSRRARAAAARAASDPSLRWYLNGQLILAVDERGVAQPALAFPIHDQLRTMLTAIPQARATYTRPT